MAGSSIVGAKPVPRLMDFEDWEDLELVIQKCALDTEGLATGFQTTFITDFAERYRKFGERLHVSIKQWKIVRDIARLYGVEVQE